MPRSPFHRPPESTPVSPSRRAPAPKRTPASARSALVRSSARSNGSAAKAAKRVFAFEEGDATMKATLGSKGAGLAEMSRIGLPVPPGFTITAQACIGYQAAQAMPKGLMDEVASALSDLERKAKATFGDPKNPLLVSVRSGAAISMPGMMDTVLNLGDRK